MNRFIFTIAFESQDRWTNEMVKDVLNKVLTMHRVNAVLADVRAVN